MKKLIFINGPAGIGKTTTCRKLLSKMNNTAWLESDWCWALNVLPTAFTPETELMVEKNVSFLLRNYLECSLVECIIFNWVLHRKHIFDRVIKNLSDLEYQLITVTLICSEEEHLRRMVEDGRDEERIKRSVNYRYLYDGLSNPIIDTTNLSVEETVVRIMEIVGG